MRGHGRRAIGRAAEVGFRGDAVKVWVISAAFRGYRGGVGMIEHVKRGFHARRGVYEAFIVTREGQVRIK